MSEVELVLEGQLLRLVLRSGSKAIHRKMNKMSLFRQVVTKKSAAFMGTQSAEVHVNIL